MPKKDFASVMIPCTISVEHCHYLSEWVLFIAVARGSELAGQEDPLFLYPIISCWTSNTAYREGRIKLASILVVKACFL